MIVHSMCHSLSEEKCKDKVVSLCMQGNRGIIALILKLGVGRDSVVGIATRYELIDPGIESRRGARFSAPVKTRLGLLYSGYRVSFPEVKRPGRGIYHPPPSSAEVKERVELYLYSPSGPLWPVLG
jgi:hypothetical protein